MHMDWTALGEVTTVSDADGTHALGVAQAGLCFLACAAFVAYGIYRIVPQFH
jgi:hypothetical protein